MEKAKKPVYKKWWFWVLVVVVLLGVYGAGDDGEKVPANVGIQNNAEEAETVKEAKKPEEEEIEIVILAKDLAQAFEDNEVRAGQEYTGKIAEIAGTVQSIGEVLGKTYITLEAYGDFAITNAQCYFRDKEEINDVADLDKGDSVVVIGKIGKKSLNVSVDNCRLK